MRFAILSLLCAVPAVFADDTATSTSVDLSDLGDKLTSLASLLPTLPPGYELPSSIVSVVDSLPTPPPNMLEDIFNNIPASVLADLMNPASRSALEEQFNNGEFPSWWKDLPTGVKSYFSEFAAQMTQQSLTYNPSGALATVAANLEGSGGNGTETPWDLGESDDDESGAIAMEPSRAVSASILVALGILGIALAL